MNQLAKQPETVCDQFDLGLKFVISDKLASEETAIKLTDAHNRDMEVAQARISTLERELKMSITKLQKSIKDLKVDMKAINKISMVNELNSGNIGSWPTLAGNTINKIRTITSKWAII